MANYTATFNFQDGFGYLDYTQYLTGQNFTRKLCIGKDGKHEYSTLDITLKSNNSLFTKYIKAKKPVLVKIKKDDADYFTGSFRSNGSFSINEKLQNFSIQILDNSTLLEKKPAEATIWKNLVVCDNTTPTTSLVHLLIGLAGLTSANYNISVYNGTVIDIFKISETELISKVMETLLYEYGLTYYFDIDGKFKIKDIAPETILPLVNFTNSNLLQPLEITKNDVDKDGVIITWYELSSKTNQLVYRQIATPEKDKIAITPLLYYPENGNNKDIFQKYKLIETDTSTTLYHSFNHTLNWNADAGIVVNKQIFNSDKAQILFKNTHSNDGTVRYLNQFDIRADVFLKSAETETKIDGDNQEGYSASYVYDEASAENLAKILKARQEFGSYDLTILSKQSFPIGTYATIQDTTTGILLNVLLLSKTETDGNPIITYTAQSVAGLMFVTSIISSSVTSIPSQVGVIGENGNSAIKLDIVSSLGTSFSRDTETTTIRAILTQDSAEIDADGTLYTYTWTVYNSAVGAYVTFDGINYSKTGKEFTVSSTNVELANTYFCVVS